MNNFWRSNVQHCNFSLSHTRKFLGEHILKALATEKNVMWTQVLANASVVIILQHMWKAKLLSHLWLWDPMDCSLPGYSVHGIFEARILEWVAISFSNASKWKVKVKSLSRVWLLETWTVAYQATLSMGFSRQEYGSGVPLPSPADSYRHRQKIILENDILFAFKELMV